MNHLSTIRQDLTFIFMTATIVTVIFKKILQLIIIEKYFFSFLRTRDLSESSCQI